MTLLCAAWLPSFVTLFVANAALESYAQEPSEGIGRAARARQGAQGGD